MSRRLHVAYVCADRGVPIGGRKGASAHVDELARALARRGAEVRIVAARVADDWEPNTAPFAVIDLARDRAARAMRQLVLTPAKTPRAQARAAETHGMLLNHHVGRALERLHRHWRIDAVYERYSLWSSAGAGFARAEGLPFLLEVNAPLRHEQKRYRSLDNEPIAASLESYLFSVADHVLVPSAALRPYVIACGARSGGVRVIPNAASLTLLRAARPARRAGDPFVVGFLGSLKPWHGLDRLLRAFRRLYKRNPDYRLLIAGDGPLRGELERAARQTGLARAVEFTGEFDHARAAELLARMDVGTAPYSRLRDFYFSPLKVFEYMAAGVPVVASEIGQIADVVTHERTGLLHRPAAIEEMAAAIERLRRDPEMAQRLAAAARRVVARRFTWEGNADRVLDLIRRRRAREVKRGSR